MFGQLLKQSHHQFARISSLLLIITHCNFAPLYCRVLVSHRFMHALVIFKNRLFCTRNFRTIYYDQHQNPNKGTVLYFFFNRFSMDNLKMVQFLHYCHWSPRRIIPMEFWIDKVPFIYYVSTCIVLNLS